jgi:hypothetical protein
MLLRGRRPQVYRDTPTKDAPTTSITIHDVFPTATAAVVKGKRASIAFDISTSDGAKLLTSGRRVSYICSAWDVQNPEVSTPPRTAKNQATIGAHETPTASAKRTTRRSGNAGVLRGAHSCGRHGPCAGVRVAGRCGHPALVAWVERPPARRLPRPTTQGGPWPDTRGGPAQRNAADRRTFLR